MHTPDSHPADGRHRPLRDALRRPARRTINTPKDRTAIPACGLVWNVLES